MKNLQKSTVHNDKHFSAESGKRGDAFFHSHGGGDIVLTKQQQKTHNSKSAIYHCKNCGLMKTAPEKFLGKIAPCPHCNTRSRVVRSTILQTLWQEAHQLQKPRRRTFLLRLREKLSPVAAHKTLGFLLLLLLSATTALYFLKI